jgi:hypothetical protein
LAWRDRLAATCKEAFMPERLVDIEKKGAKVLHTFPVTISAPAAQEEAFKQKALEAAGKCEIGPQRGTRESER